MKSFLVSDDDHKKVKHKSAEIDLPIQEIISYLINNFLDQVEISKSTSAIKEDVPNIFEIEL